MLVSLASLLAALPARAQLGLPISPGDEPPIPAEAAERFSWHLMLAGPGAVRSLPPGVPVDSAEGRRLLRQRLAELEAQRRALYPALSGGGLRIVGDHRLLVNGVQVVAGPAERARLSRLPGVVAVERASVFQRATSRATPLVGAPALWGRETPLTGRGIRIAVVDSGVDYLHANFGGPGTVEEYAANDPRIVEAGSFPTRKVVRGADLVGDRYAPGGLPEPDPDPLDCAADGLFSGHGTLVASAAAGFGVTSTGATYRGSYAMSFDPAAFAIGPGVAPDAELYAAKIFGCGQEFTDALLAGLEWAIDPDGDGDLSDRADVVNASLGTRFGQGSAAEREAVESLLSLGVSFVAPVGNEAVETHGFFGASFPATVAGAIAVGGSLSAPQSFLSARATEGAGPVHDYPYLEARTASTLAQTGPISAPLGVAMPREACAPLAGEALRGRVALVARGTCTFMQKLTNAAGAGAVAVLFIDNSYFDVPVQIGNVAGAPIPAGLLRRRDGEELLRLLANGPVEMRLAADQAHPQAYGPDAVAPLSLRGPDAVSGLLKPDLVAPSLGLTLAASGQGAGASTERGTSLAGPLVAGAAALLLQAEPGLTPAALKAALMGAARSTHLLAGDDFPLSLQGAGRLDVARAADLPVRLFATAAPERVSLSFDAILAERPTTRSAQLTVAQRAGAGGSYRLRAELLSPLPGVEVRLDQSELSLAGGEAATVALELAVDPDLLPAPTPDGVTARRVGALGARHFLVEAAGFVVLEAEGVEVARLPFYAPVRAAHELGGRLAAGCAGEPIRLSFSGADAHPGGRAVVGIFQHLPGAGTGSVAAVGYAYGADTLYLAVASSGVLVTPATYPNPHLSAFLDVDRDGTIDYELVTDGFDESLGDRAAIRDTLKVKVAPYGSYDPNASLPFTFLNAIQPDVAQTFPYYTDVWVLPVRLADLGISDPGQPIAAWIHVGPRIRLPAPRFTEIIPAGAEVEALRDGLPIWLDGQAVELRYRGAAPAADVLVLSFTGAPGTRHTVLPLRGLEQEGGELSLVADAPRTVEGEDVTVRVTVHNPSSSAAGTSILEVAGDEQVSWQDCAMPCALPRLGPGESVERTLLVTGMTPGAHQLTLSLSVAGCTRVGAPVQLGFQRLAPMAPVTPAPSMVEQGSCGCTSTGRPAPGVGALLGLALLLLRWARRRV